MSERIGSRIQSFIRTGAGDFEELALDLFAYQFELNKAYRAYASQIGKTPKSINGWKEIPAVSVAAFKSSELATFPVSQAAVHFESSGTTRQVRSHHYLKTLNYYEASVKGSFQKAILHDDAKLPFLILTPSPAEAPRSSLTWMMDVVGRQFSEKRSIFFVQRGRLDELYLLTHLSKAHIEQKPVVLLGTTIAFIALLEYLDHNNKSFRLPPGSRLMDTGGLKTDKRSLARPMFVQKVDERLGIPASMCFNEYGMCELSSQCYGKGSESYLEGPPWMRTVAIDPFTGGDALPGQAGLLRHFDLANVDSVMALQTEDLGVMQGRGFVYQGRDPDAEVRGCSLAAEAFIHE